jgi:hypothetical protein
MHEVSGVGEMASEENEVVGIAGQSAASQFVVDINETVSKQNGADPEGLIQRLNPVEHGVT